MRAATPSALQPGPRRTVRLSRLAVQQFACCGVIVLIFISTWSIYIMRNAVLAERSASQAAHTSAVRLVRLAMELQAELDAQECAHVAPFERYPVRYFFGSSDRAPN